MAINDTRYRVSRRYKETLDTSFFGFIARFTVFIVTFLSRENKQIFEHAKCYTRASLEATIHLCNTHDISFLFQSLVLSRTRVVRRERAYVGC